MPWKLGSRRIAYDVPFTNEGTGIQYPANWLRITNDRDKQAIGMIWEEPEATNYDQRFYWSADNPKQLDDVTDEEGNTTTGLKTEWKVKQNEIAASLLNDSDKRVIKALDEATSFAEFKAAKPSNYTTYRAAVRTACNTRQTEIDNCSDVAALKELLFGSATITRQQTDSEGNGVVEPDTITDEEGNTVDNPVAGNPVMETVANPNIATAWPDTIE
nr:Na-Ca exchanger/integrin-beta4 [uncultured Mediterranean phage uvMED]BAR23954.1 Na-Ca exchanger/integrin-beta4 [uncultured Mediterranean phage uvMED]